MLLHSHSRNTATWSGQASALRGMGEAFWRLPWTLLQPLLWGPSRGKVMAIRRSAFSNFLVSVSLTSQSATSYPHSLHNSCCAFSHFPYMKKKEQQSPFLTRTSSDSSHPFLKLHLFVWFSGLVWM